MAALPFQLFKSQEIACVKYNTVPGRLAIIGASALDSSKDGTLFAAGISKKVQVCSLHVDCFVDGLYSHMYYMCVEDTIVCYIATCYYNMI